MTLPKYVSHKQVEAVQIEEMESDGVDTFLVSRNHDVIKVSMAYMTKHEPKIGGYYVRYADGYESYSPAKAFEEGYTRL